MMPDRESDLSSLGRSIIRSSMLFILGRDATAALIRFIVLAALVAIHWVVVIAGLRFPGEIPVYWLRTFPPFTYPLLNIASTFLNPEVLLHLLPVLAGVLLGLLIAARYLSDLFELDRFEIAWRYLSGAIYGLSTPRLRIDRGAKDSLDAKNPIRRIGGPGIIQTHLGYAAVFESIHGIPRVYGLSHPPASSQKGAADEQAAPQASYTIQGFERLRDVVDLRDRITRVDLVRAETRDGVEVLAQDTQMVFRVFGGGEERSLKNPYPYSDEAIRRLVYAQPVSIEHKRRASEALKDIVLQEIRTFVGRYSLEEFLALQPYRQLEAQSQASVAESPTDLKPSIQIPRRELTERFHTPDLHQRLKDQGLEMDWVGVGTWSIRELNDEDGGSSSDNTLIRTWRDSQRLMLYRSTDYLSRQRQQALQQRPANFIQEWFESWEAGELPQAYRCYELLSTLARQLQALEKQFESGSSEHSDIRLLRQHLDSLLDPQILGSESP